MLSQGLLRPIDTFQMHDVGVLSTMANIIGLRSQGIACYLMLINEDELIVQDNYTDDAIFGNIQVVRWMMPGIMSIRWRIAKGSDLGEYADTHTRQHM